MHKSMYSLILSDPVVARIDQLSYQRGLSRSQLIDQLLAAEVGLHTPEQRVRLIIEQVTGTVKENSSLQISVRSDMGGMQFATYLRYKYNPGIRIQVEFQNHDGQMTSVLKVFSRSTSVDLLMHLNRFFTLFSAIDTTRFQEFLNLPVQIRISSQTSNKFARLLVSPQMKIENIEEPVIAEYLSQYVMMLDESLQCYFLHYSDPIVTDMLDQIYCKHMKNLELKKEI